jgi:exodeoxyribonuclease VII small subunit
LTDFGARGKIAQIMAESGQSPGFDQVLGQLRQIVERLEGGNLTLEQSLAAFEEGVRLSRQGAQILDAAEQRVEVLLRDEQGALRTTAFAPAGAPGGAAGGAPGGAPGGADGGR